jgi:hypothetical protein
MYAGAWLQALRPGCFHQGMGSISGMNTMHAFTCMLMPLALIGLNVFWAPLLHMVHIAEMDSQPHFSFFGCRSSLAPAAAGLTRGGCPGNTSSKAQKAGVHACMQLCCSCTALPPWQPGHPRTEAWLYVFASASSWEGNRGPPGNSLWSCVCTAWQSLFACC